MVAEAIKMHPSAEAGQATEPGELMVVDQERAGAEGARWTDRPMPPSIASAWGQVLWVMLWQQWLAKSRQQ